MTDSSAATTNRADLPELVEATLDELVERARRLLDDHGWGAVRDCLDEVWFLAVDSAVRERRLVRRRQLFGHSVAEAHSCVASVDEKNATITDPTRTRADLVVHLFTHLGTSGPAPRGETAEDQLDYPPTQGSQS